jgi:hypothetical protein
MTDARQPLPGNSSYVQNRTTVQTGTNFNISGVGNASVFNAATQFNLNNSRILGTGTGVGNTFGGINAGANASNLSDDNTFFGNSAGQNMVTAGGNSFFGSEAGQNTTAGSNTFVGARSGNLNTTGSSNSFFGLNAGNGNTTGSNNSFYGRSAGSGNQTGDGNSFFGFQAGLTSNTDNNSFFGYTAGKLTTGINNSFFGWSSGAANTTGTNNAFFGVQSGLNNSTGIRNVFIGRDAGLANVSGSNNTVIGAFASLGAPDLNFATAIGAGATVSSGNNVVIGRSIDKVSIPGRLEVAGNIEAPGVSTIIFGNAVRFNETVSFGTTATFDAGVTAFFPVGGVTPICYVNVDPDNNIRMPARCSSSRVFKKNILPFRSGLALIHKLQPVSFRWRSDGSPDIGLVAEDVNSVEPLLITTDAKGEVEGVKYDRLGVVLINAIKEQQAQIESQSAELAALNAKLKKQAGVNAAQAAEIRLLRNAICSIRPRLTICVK